MKQKWHIHRPDHVVFAFAGLWERWTPRQPSADSDLMVETADVLTCTILTTSANADISPIHDRMPVILTPDQCATWLSNEATSDQLSELMHPLPDGALELTKV